MDARVGMRAEIVALQRRRAEDFAQPSQIAASRKCGAELPAPVAAQSIDFAPMFFPAQLRENLARL